MSSISTWEHFLANDWQRYASVASWITCLVCGGLGVASVLFSFGAVKGLYCIFVALVLAIWEFPFIYVCIPNFDKFGKFLQEQCYLKYEEAKAVLYVVLSIATFAGLHLVNLAGVALLLTAALMTFAAINRRADQRDGLTFDDEQPYEPKVPPQVTRNGLLAATSKFGTF